MSANTSGGHEVCQALCRVSYSVRKFSFLLPSAVWTTHKAAVMICMFYAILYGGHKSVASLLVAFLSLCRVQNRKCKWACTRHLALLAAGLESRYSNIILSRSMRCLNSLLQTKSNYALYLESRLLQQTINPGTMELGAQGHDMN